MGINEILYTSLSFIFLSSLIIYLIVRKNNKIKNNSTESETKKKEIQIINSANEYYKNRKNEISTELNKIKEREKEVESKNQILISKIKNSELMQKDLLKKKTYLDKIITKKNNVLDELISDLEKVSNLTEEEAKKSLFSNLKDKLELDFAKETRKSIQLAKEEGEKKANYILSQVVTRYAGKFAHEELINTIKLPNNDDKGRIIGKKGRNIKYLEVLLGVDIIINEIPGVIIVSNFNYYRRTIAVETIKLLIEDGRIHPQKIEELFNKTKADFKNKIFKDGENVLIELGLYPMNKEITTLIGRLRYRSSYGQNALKHTLEVARLASAIAMEMGGDSKLALRAGLLHDIGKALTQETGENHVDLGAKVCTNANEHPTVINAIYAHHGLREPDSIESAAVCTADILSASRPGARSEVLDTFIKRVKEIEDIAFSYDGVLDAYAINGGREVRVFINPFEIDENTLSVISQDMKKKIESKVQFPGEIKIVIIRENREISYARQSIK